MPVILLRILDVSLSLGSLKRQVRKETDICFSLVCRLKRHKGSNENVNILTLSVGTIIAPWRIMVIECQ